MIFTAAMAVASIAMSVDSALGDKANAKANMQQAKAGAAVAKADAAEQARKNAERVSENFSREWGKLQYDSVKALDDLGNQIDQAKGQMSLEMAMAEGRGVDVSGGSMKNDMEETLRNEETKAYDMQSLQKEMQLDEMELSNKRAAEANADMVENANRQAKQQLNQADAAYRQAKAAADQKMVGAAIQFGKDAQSFNTDFATTGADGSTTGGFGNAWTAASSFAGFGGK